MKTILLFGFSDLRAALAVASIARELGAQAESVDAKDCSLSLSDLAEGRRGGGREERVSEPMLLFCGMDGELDAILPRLKSAGVSCLKAVLTPSNRGWTPSRLCRELQRERRAISGGK
ncbi:MAG: DUF3783 domain-containing protein [Oscillibacter sp.]|nr:DUF3783 domain-containing protein [Oscillibacter sp.]